MKALVRDTAHHATGRFRRHVRQMWDSRGGGFYGFVAVLMFLYLETLDLAGDIAARYLVRDRLAGRLVRDPRFQRIDQALCRNGLRVMLLIRLSPVFPFSLLNYALGLSRVRLRDYVLGSVSMLPGTALYVYPGMVAGQVVALGAGYARPRETGYYVTLAAGLVVTVLALVLLTRVARRALREETDETLAV